MWEPKFESTESDGAPIYVRIVEALARDVETGRLTGGASLPPHRALAERLGVSPGTVTRAYREAEVRGLIEGHVGRGTRVRDAVATGSATAAIGGTTGGRRDVGEASATPWRDRVRPRQRASSMLNLALNEPPIVPALGRLSHVFADLARSPDEWLDFCRYGPATGFELHRHVLGTWLRERGVPADPHRMALCKGAQHAIGLALAACTRRGDVLLVENNTYSGVRTAAEVADLHLVPLEMDDEGVLPDSLAEAVRRHGARVAYLVPTLQNPTTATMSLARRNAIVDVARRAGLLLIEDDVYGALVADAPPTLTRLAPEICFHVTSLSKTVCPSLRTGILLAPSDRHFGQITRGLQANNLTTASFDAVLAARLVENGDADAIIAEVREDSIRRTSAARDILGDAVDLRSVDGGFHIWLPVPADDIDQVIASAMQDGIAITSSAAVRPSEDRRSGLRLCLGAPPFDDLVAGLATLRPLLL